MSRSSSKSSSATTRHHLTTLPAEVQQLIYRHVYPLVDVTLEQSLPRDCFLTNYVYWFRLVEPPSTSLLQTSRLVYSLAKPIRDSCYTGRINTHSLSYLNHLRRWIRERTKVIWVLKDSAPLHDIHLSLFPNLCRVEIMMRTYTQDMWPGRLSWNNDASIAVFPDREIVTCATIHAPKFISSATDTRNDVPCNVRLRFEARWKEEETHLPVVLGTTVRFDGRGQQPYVIEKIYREGTELTMLPSRKDVSLYPRAKTAANFIWNTFVDIKPRRWRRNAQNRPTSPAAIEILQKRAWVKFSSIESDAEEQISFADLTE